MMEAARREAAGVGAVLGACVGDAAGAVLEFLGRRPSPEEVEAALGMPGGGVWGVAPGQITDDGELTLCLAQGLAVQEGFSLEQVARSYAAWVESAPFDIGSTTRAALGCVSEPAWRAVCERQGYAAAMTQAAQARNQASKANGSLMRCSPLGVWGWRLEPARLAMLARQDSRLSHPNPACADAVACYVLAVAALVRAPGDARGAWAVVQGWAAAQACEEVRGWLRSAEQGEEVAFEPQMGFARIGFVWAMRHLLAETPWEEAARQVLSGGGDTDTNACIVGGLLGALHGEGSIPASARAAVLGCDPTQSARRRPAALAASQAPALARLLLERAPAEAP
jgi:ADP-ribosyl-[dinitrogen reductase] hydrolase